MAPEISKRKKAEACLSDDNLREGELQWHS